jgi:hypothetical protein
MTCLFISFCVPDSAEDDAKRPFPLISQNPPGWPFQSGSIQTTVFSFDLRVALLLHRFAV